MNLKQRMAAEQLETLLEECHELGLSGGVYGGNFCLWPSAINPHEGKSGFFDVIEEKGQVLMTKMYLDGGAGT